MTGYKLIVIEPDGTINALYDEVLAKLGGKQKITRASSVEPEPDGKGWSVILTDALQNGKFKGHVVARNVPLRSTAIRLEIDFIETNILCEGAP
jgi:hypothetical protein